jgi:hypothetical protein
VSEICCPACGHKANINLTAYLPRETKLAFRLTPKPGELMSAKAIGGSLKALYDLNRSIGKDMGANCTTLVENVEMKDGEITFHVHIVNVAGVKP